MLEAQLLGKFEVRLNGQPIDLASRPAQSLLAYLLLNPNQPIRREKLGGLIWETGLNEKILDTRIQDYVSANYLIKIFSAHGGELSRKFYKSQVAMRRVMDPANTRCNHRRSICGSPLR
jgi:hypothetical protein